MTLLAFREVEGAPTAHLLGSEQRQWTASACPERCGEAHGAGADALATQASELNSAILAKQGQRETPRLPGVFRLLAWAQEKMGTNL